MRITDIVVALICLYYLYRGWRKGLFRTILGPVSLVICVIAGYIYFLNTGKLLIAIAIGLLGPMAIALIFSILLNLWGRVKDKDSKMSIISRMLGGILSLSWAVVMIVLAFVIFSFIPPQFLPISNIREDVNDSITFTYLSEIMKDRVPTMARVKFDEPVVQTQASQEMLQSTDEYQSLMADERIQEILSDETLQEQIQNKEYVQLLNNKKIQELLEDKSLVEDFIELSNKIIEINNQQAHMTEVE